MALLIDHLLNYFTGFSMEKLHKNVKKDLDKMN